MLHLVFFIWWRIPYSNYKKNVFSNNMSKKTYKISLNAKKHKNESEKNN